MVWITMFIRGTVFEDSILPSEGPDFPAEANEGELEPLVTAFELLLAGTRSRVFSVGVA